MFDLAARPSDRGVFFLRMGKVIGFHIICCTYGFWLPNDERGSGSDFVRSEELAKFGPANPVSRRRSVAGKPFDRTVARMAREALKFPHVELNGAQIASVGRGVTREIEAYAAAPVYAFAQLRDHFHLVCGTCRYDVRRFAGRVKSAGTRQLVEDGIHPLAGFRDERGDVPTPWAVKPWVVYLFSDEDVVRCVKYAHENLVRARLPEQVYSFVVPYVREKRAPGASHRR